MRIKVRFFALHRVLTGKSEIELEVEDNTTVAALQQKLVADFPALEEHADTWLVAVGTNYIRLDFVLYPGAEVSLLPPLGGG